MYTLQVNSNLLVASDRLSPSSLLTSSIEGVMCFPCDQLLQYQRVTSKLGGTSEDVKKGTHVESELYKHNTEYLLPNVSHLFLHQY